MIDLRTATCVVGLAYGCALPAAAVAQVSPIVPFTPQPGLVVVDGDPTVAGVPYVLRIHNDSGYVVLPHVHAEIEHIVVISGRWSLALGDTYDPGKLEAMEVGDYAQVPARAPHYGRARTALTIQVHGIGPFYTDYHNPVYRLTQNGIFFEDMAGTLGERVTQSLAGCFPHQVGDRVSVGPTVGTVLEAQCSPTDDFTQYWVQPRSGPRFWAPANELSP